MGDHAAGAVGSAAVGAVVPAPLPVGWVISVAGGAVVSSSCGVYTAMSLSDFSSE